MDSHNTQRYVTKEGNVQDEGDVQVSPGGPYVISYGSIIPKKAECENLLVPAAVSSSHIAYGSIRMEPVFMVLGQSAATGAVIAIDGGSSVQDVPFAVLRERLLKDGQVLDLPEGSKPRRLLLVSTLAGVVVDESSAEYDGQWQSSQSAAQFIEREYRHDVNEAKGDKRATFSADLKTAGRYEVRFSYPAHGNRATNVPVTIYHKDKKTTITVNQKVNKGDAAGFVSLGTFEFSKGPTKVVISNQDTDGYVVVDAVQWLKSR
jgi:Zn-dependent M28 family amino/carboxypeptidase